MNLDAYQQKAVEATDSKVLVVAVPGSGKTLTVVSRLEYMVNTLKIDPRNIVLLTFTRYASQEMISRTSRKIGQSSYIGTIHAFALKIIKMEGQSRGWAPDYLSILDEEEAQAEEWTALQNTGLVDTKNNWKGFCNQHLWDRFKENKLSEKPLPTTFPEELKPKLEDAWKSFVDHLRAENALTFGMLLLEALAIVEANDDASRRLRMRFVHFLTDESQDTDALQWRFIHAFKPETLYVTGDGDQSIYGFRGARPDLLMKFSEGATIYKLPNSYRFGITIGDAANKLIKNNTNRIDMAIQAIAENKGTIQTVTDAKYSDVASIIMEQLKHYKPADIAVLARTHMVLDNLTRDMDRSKIPFTKIGGQFDVTRSKEFRVLKGALRLAYNRKDNRAFMAVSHLLGLDTQDLWNIRQASAQSDRSFIEEYEAIHKRNPFEMANIAEVEPKLKDFKNYGAYQFGESLDYIDHICKREAIIKPEEVIHYVALADIQDSLIDKSDTVKLLSAHASKGLQWPVVIVLGMSSGIWPSPRSVKEGNIEEERRILYVAVSRAEQKLFLIQKLPAFKNESKPSMFVDELGQMPEYVIQKPYSQDDDLKY